MKGLNALRRVLRSSDDAAQSLRELVAGHANQTELLNQRLREIAAALANQTNALNRVLARLPELPPTPGLEPAAAAAEPAVELDGFAAAMGRMPLMIDARTYNTSHPDYDATLVRNDPGRIFNRALACANPAFAALAARAAGPGGDSVADGSWGPILAEMLAEAKSVPHAAQVFERRAFIEDYVAGLERRYGAYYQPGWVNLDDALFLYWLVRRTRPKTIVQCGVCNGLSASFLMLALAKNGPDGTLHVIDLPPVFDPADPGWTVPGKVYGVVIPEGKTTGWMVPDAYRDRFEVWNGDAKDLLPQMVDKLDSIDLFYHDSDHTYDHMMFEFTQAKRKLTPGGLIVGDDISWNASVWDFADQHHVPSYNFKGAVGVAFF